MIEDDQAVRTVELLVGRMQFVDRLRQGTLQKPEMVDELGTSRSTVDRAVRDLETHGIIEATDDGYTTTTVGDLVAGKLGELGETVRTGRRLTPFLEWIDADAFDLDLGALADADLYLPEPGDPYAMVNRHVTVLEGTTDHRLVLPLVGLHGFQAVHDVVLGGGGESEAVVASSVAETIRSNPEYAPLYEELATSDRFSVYVYDGEIPYFVGILDTTVQVGVDEDGEPRALLETKAAEVRQWAENRFQSFKQDADRLT